MILNAVLLWKIIAHETTDSRIDVKSASLVRPAPAPAQVPVEHASQQTINPSSDLSSQIKALRNAGFDDEVVTCIVLAQIEMQFAQKKAELFYPEGTPFWRMGAVNRNQLKPIEDEQSALARAIMGDEKFSIYLRNHSLEYQLAEGLISDTGAPSSISLRAWAIQDELARAVAKVQSANDPLLAMKVEQLRLRANQELAAIVGAEKARVYLETVQPKP